ncbi:MAG: S41 family peptidase, partial [Proteobacteria bacterium]|nr:S41 family peptidase [Pseudomonadota bacterium]
ILSRARLEALVLEASEATGHRRDKEKIILRGVKNYFNTLRQYFILERDSRKAKLYHDFVRAVYKGIDRHVEYSPTRDILELYQLMNNNPHAGIVGSLVNVNRDWDNPYWQIIEAYDTHHEKVFTDDLLRPGDIILAMSTGTKSFLVDTSYSHTLMDLLRQSTHDNYKRGNKKTLLTLRPGTDGQAQTRLVSLVDDGAQLPLITGFFPLSASHENIPEETMLGYLKLLAFPDDDAALNQVYYSLNEDIKSIIEFKPDVLLIDLRTHNFMDKGHGSSETIRKFLSYFLPFDLGLGYVRSRDRSGMEDSRQLISQMPESLSEEDYEKLQSIPIVVLTSYLSREYHEWVAQIFKFYQRAILVGDPHTRSKDTVNTLASKREYFLSVPNSRLYTPKGLNFTSDPLTIDITIPSITPSLEEYYVRYEEDIYDDNLLYEVDDLSSNYSDLWLSDELKKQLSTRSKQRVAQNSKFDFYQELRAATKSAIGFKPKEISLDISDLERVDSDHLTPNAVTLAKGLNSEKRLMNAVIQLILQHDHTLIEAMNIANDYYYHHAEGKMPNHLSWRLATHNIIKVEETPNQAPTPKGKKPKKPKRGFD